MKQKLTVLLMWPMVWIMPNIKLAIRSFSYFSENKFCIYQGFKEILNSVKLFSKKCLWYNFKNPIHRYKGILSLVIFIWRKNSVSIRGSPTNQMEFYILDSKQKQVWTSSGELFWAHICMFLLIHTQWHVKEKKEKSKA